MNGHSERCNLHCNEIIFQRLPFVSETKPAEGIVLYEIANHVCAFNCAFLRNELPPSEYTL